MLVSGQLQTTQNKKEADPTFGSEHLQRIQEPLLFLGSPMKTFLFLRNESQRQGAKKKRKLDVLEFGLWAQHASTAPLRFVD